jgi:mannose-6-phosphate isomerase-like protein (cupin superfamily)
MKPLNLEELLKRSAPKPDQIFTERVVDEKDKAEKVQAMLMIIPPNAPRLKLHSHTQREGWMLVLSGEGKMVTEGQELMVKANDLFFVPAKEKHRIENTGKTDLKVLEMYSLPHDFIVAE